MSDKLKFGIVGFGSRGRMFADLIMQDTNAQLVAVADVAKSALVVAKEKYGIPADRCFGSADGFFEQGKICDAVFICTQDAEHYGMVIKALNLGYDVCLEKPAAVTEEQCVSIRDTANRLGRKIMLTHVLRYSPFYQYLRKLIVDKTIGEAVTINQTENIAYWHFALSYVRGPWRNMEESSPTIIAKCCHDLDIIRWLMGKHCVSVSSYGGLYYYNPTHAPEGSAEYCVDCRKDVKEKCVYNAYKIYPERMKHSVVGGTAALKDRDIYAVLDNKESSISKCVFRSDNDAVDHQVVNMSFENGATAHLTMTAFSDRCYRFIKVHGTEGEVYGDLEDGILYVTLYGREPQKIDVSKEKVFNADGIDLSGGHGGGDYYLYRDFVNYITVNDKSETRTTIDDSIESHIMGFKAEESRLQNGKVQEIL